MEKAGFKEYMDKTDHKKFIFTELDRNFLVFFSKPTNPQILPWQKNQISNPKRFSWNLRKAGTELEALQFFWT